MSFGRILLLAVGVLVLCGIGQRVLDRLRLTDRQALLFIGLIFVGGWIPSIPLGGGVSVNIGGALVPLGLCIYLMIRAGTAKERWRAVFASMLSAAAVLLLGMALPDEPETMPFDVNYLYGLVAGVIAYLLGAQPHFRVYCGRDGRAAGGLRAGGGQRGARRAGESQSGRRGSDGRGGALRTDRRNAG